MPRYEYVDHEGRVHVITAEFLGAAQLLAWRREIEATNSLTLADRAAGTVELSDERSRAA